MKGFVGRIAVGGWDLVPRAGGTIEPCGDRPGRWRGVFTVSTEVARAIAGVSGGSPLRLHTDSGLGLRIAPIRWSPVGSHALVEFTGEESSPARAVAGGGAS